MLVTTAEEVYKEVRLLRLSGHLLSLNLGSDLPFDLPGGHFFFIMLHYIFFPRDVLPTVPLFPVKKRGKTAPVIDLLQLGLFATPFDLLSVSFVSPVP